MRIYEIGSKFWTFSIGKLDDSYHCNVQRLGRKYTDLEKGLGHSVPHPDVARVRIQANIECVETAYVSSWEHYAVGFGETPEEAETDVIRRIQAPGIYAPCPRCCATRSDLDFEPSHVINLIAWKVRCRLCGHERDAQ